MERFELVFKRVSDRSQNTVARIQGQDGPLPTDMRNQFRLIFKWDSRNTIPIYLNKINEVNKIMIYISKILIKCKRIFIKIMRRFKKLI